MAKLGLLVHLRKEKKDGDVMVKEGMVYLTPHD